MGIILAEGRGKIANPRVSNASRKRPIKLPMEGFKMFKTVYTAAAAIALLSLGSYVSAQAGGATSAPCKYSQAAQAAATPSAPQQHANAQTATADVAITEFSSSSAKSTVPHR